MSVVGGIVSWIVVFALYLHCLSFSSNITSSRDKYRPDLHAARASNAPHGCTLQGSQPGRIQRPMTQSQQFRAYHHFVLAEAHRSHLGMSPVCLYRRITVTRTIRKDINKFYITLILGICKPSFILTIFDVIRDARYFMLRHWSSVKIGTSTCWTNAGSVPPSEVRPQPTTVPNWPAGSLRSLGKQTGRMVLVNSTGLRSFRSAMSWL